jgi:anti-anti-sigma regulatory factor
MEININDLKDYTIIKFNKKSVIGTEGTEFQNSIISTLDKGVHSIVIDLSTVEYITSWGIGILFRVFTTTSN